MIENSQKREGNTDAQPKQKEHITLDMTSFQNETRERHHRPKTSNTIRPQEVNVIVINNLYWDIISYRNQIDKPGRIGVQKHLKHF